MKNTLNDFEERGRKEKAEQAQQESRKAGAVTRSASRQALTISKVSMTWLGEYWPDDVFDWIIWPVILFSIPWLIPIFGKENNLKVDAILIAGFLLLMAVARAVGAVLYRRELAWLAALPFPVTGYIESLGDISGRISAPNVDGSATGVTFRLRFRSTPGVSVEDIFRGFDPKAEFTTYNDGLLATKPDWLGGASNYPLHKYFRRLVRRVLIPLSQAYPLDSVAVRQLTSKNEFADADRVMQDVIAQGKRTADQYEANNAARDRCTGCENDPKYLKLKKQAKSGNKKAIHQARAALYQCYIDNKCYKEAGTLRIDNTPIETTLAELTEKRDESLEQLRLLGE